MPEPQHAGTPRHHGTRGLPPDGHHGGYGHRRHDSNGRHGSSQMAAMAQTAARGCREMDQRKTTVNRPCGMTAASSPQLLVSPARQAGCQRPSPAPITAPITSTCHQRPAPPADGHRPCMAKSGVIARGRHPYVPPRAPGRGHGPFRINQGADMSMARASGAVPLMSAALTLL